MNKVYVSRFVRDYFSLSSKKVAYPNKDLPILDVLSVFSVHNVPAFTFEVTKNHLSNHNRIILTLVFVSAAYC